jgi:PAS domain S-box-containing protein
MTSGWEGSAVLNRIRHAMGLLHNRTGQWSALLAASIAFQAISIAIIFALFAGLDANVGPAECALIAAMVGVAAALPLSINGLGLMEGALVGGAVALGIGYEEALVVAFVRRLLATCLAAGCGLVHLGVDGRGEGDEGRGGLTKLAASLRGHAFAYLAAWKQSAAAPSGAKDQTMLASGDAARLTIGAGHQEEERHWPHAGLLEDTHDAIIIWEMDGNGIQYFNRAAERLYGYRRAEAAGKTTHALLKTRLAGGIDLLEHDLARFGVWVGELEHTTRDGRPVVVESRLALLSQQNGRWLVLEVNSDITDRKAMEGGRRPAEEKIAELLALGSTP